MKTVHILLIVFVIVVSVSCSLGRKVTDLKIIKQYVPEKCKVTAAHGDVVQVHYTGTLENGDVFDTSRGEGREPFSFQLGSGTVIQGWEQGIKGMCEGEKRKLIVPPHLGYGSMGSGPIPGDAVLSFETEMLSIQKRSIASNFDIFQLISFLSAPLLVGYVVYYLWTKATSAPSKRELKMQRKSRKR